MYPSEFEYHRPTTVAEAVKLIAANPDARVIAGGHSLLPAMKLRLSQPVALVDIGRIEELKTISANGSLQIGALATHAQIAASSQVKSYCPALASATGMVGDQQVRNFGTLGGNIAHADPASDPPTVLVAAGATIHVQGSGGARAVAAENFFVDLFATDLKSGELVTKIEVPNLGSRKSAYAKLVHPASRYAIVGACAVLEMDGDTCRSARLAVGGATPNATRVTDAEAALAGKKLDDATLDSAVAAMSAQIKDNVSGDIHASEAYRLAMAGVFLKKAIRAAVG